MQRHYLIQLNWRLDDSRSGGGHYVIVGSERTLAGPGKASGHVIMNVTVGLAGERLKATPHEAGPTSATWHLLSPAAVNSAL